MKKEVIISIQLLTFSLILGLSGCDDHHEIDEYNEVGVQDTTAIHGVYDTN
jgi:hypothetical protein